MVNQQENVCYVPRQNARLGYVVKLRTMKYARQLMSKWHNRVVEGVPLKCQLELNPKQLLNAAQPLRKGKDTGSKSEPSHSPERYTRSLQSEQDTIQKADVENMGSGVFNEREANANQRIMRQATKSLPKNALNAQPQYTSSPESIPNATDSSCKLRQSMLDVQLLWLL